jgi:hypothetical protein
MRPDRITIGPRPSIGSWYAAARSGNRKRNRVTFGTGGVDPDKPFAELVPPAFDPMILARSPSQALARSWRLRACRIHTGTTSGGWGVQAPSSDGALTSVEPSPYEETRLYVVHAVNGNGQSGPSNEVKATGSRPLLAQILNFWIPQDFFTGWLGMQIHVGNTRLKVVALGRKNYLNPQTNPVPIVHDHDMKVVLAGTPVDVAESQLTIGPQSGVEAGPFVYETLKTDVFLEPDTTYYVVSHEKERTAIAQDEDQWHDFDTTARTATPYSIRPLAAPVISMCR